MTTDPAPLKPKRNGALISLWVVGGLAIVGGLIAHVNLKAAARADARSDAIFNDLTGTGDSSTGIDYTAANYALWVVALGALMVVAAIIIQAARRPAL